MNKTKQRLILCFLIVLVPFELNGFYNPWVSKYQLIYWVLEIATWILLPSIVFTTMIKCRFTSLETLGLKANKPNRRHYGISIFFSILMTFLFFKGYVAAKSFAYHNWPQNYFAVNFSYTELANEHPSMKRIMIFYYALTAGFVEEIYFRGVLRTLFYESIVGKISFVTISSLLFASVHWEQGIRGLFATFVAGVIAGSYYVFRKDLWPLIVAHTGTWLLLYL